MDIHILHCFSGTPNKTSPYKCPKDWTVKYRDFSDADDEDFV